MARASVSRLKWDKHTLVRAKRSKCVRVHDDIFWDVGGSVGGG